MAYLLALASSTSFSVASLIFTEISRRVSPLWMNAFKAIVAWVLFGLTVLIFNFWVDLDGSVVLALVVSGMLGLGIGDVFLLNAYARMGAARTLILFGFQPFFIGIAAHFVFGQEIGGMKMIAVIFFVGCLFTFSLEKFREEGHWELPGLAAALTGVIFDNCGLILSRWAFDQAQDMNAFQANFLRCSGALLFFAVFSLFRPIKLREGWLKLDRSSRKLALVAVAMGTFLSLFLYLTAVKIGHLASLSALGVIGPILTSAFECAYYRKRPSAYLLVALLLFVVGFSVLIFA
jgi:drug/metabolite transporter (DMT)-like permease